MWCRMLFFLIDFSIPLGKIICNFFIGNSLNFVIVGITIFLWFKEKYYEKIQTTKLRYVLQLIVLPFIIIYIIALQKSE